MDFTKKLFVGVISAVVLITGIHFVSLQGEAAYSHNTLVFDYEAGANGPGKSRVGVMNGYSLYLFNGDKVKISSYQGHSIDEVGEIGSLSVPDASIADYVQVGYRLTAPYAGGGIELVNGEAIFTDNTAIGDGGQARITARHYQNGVLVSEEDLHVDIYYLYVIKSATGMTQGLWGQDNGLAIGSQENFEVKSIYNVTNINVPSQITLSYYSGNTFGLTADPADGGTVEIETSGGSVKFDYGYVPNQPYVVVEESQSSSSSSSSSGAAPTPSQNGAIVSSNSSGQLIRTLPSTGDGPVASIVGDISYVPTDARLTSALVPNNSQTYVDADSAVNNILGTGNRLAGVMDFSLYGTLGPVHQLRGAVEVTVDLPAGIVLQPGQTLTVYRLNDDGTLTKCTTAVSGNKLSFTTDHFSTYLLVVDEATEQTSETERKSPKTGEE